MCIPYDDEAVAAGQGTLGLEMLQAVPDLDTLVIAVGGGGLISGVATAAKAIKPGIEIIGVQTARFPAMVNAVKGTHHPQGTSTIAEGIAVGTPDSKITQEIVKRLVDDLVLVDEGDIEQAVLMLLEIEKPWWKARAPQGWRRCCATPNASRASAWAWCCAAATSTTAAGRHHRARHGALGAPGAHQRSAHAMCPACWRASPPRWQTQAPTSRKCTTSAPSPCWPHRMWKLNWCCKRGQIPRRAGAGPVAHRRHGSRAHVSATRQNATPVAEPLESANFQHWAITMSDHTSHNSSEPSSDPVENVVSAMPVVLPVVGGIMMFLLAFIAVKMA